MYDNDFDGRIRVFWKVKAMAKKRTSDAYRKLTGILIILFVLTALCAAGYVLLDQSIQVQQAEHDARAKAENEQLEVQYQQAKQEAQEGESVATDDYYRIPAIMQDCKTAFNLTWNGSGSWDGNTFVRTATMPNINGTITFKATVSIARKPKYFLGIKIHRAIVQIAWELTTEYSDTQVVAVLNLDPEMSDQEKADMVNQKLSEVAREFPNCEPNVEYAKSEPMADDDTSDTYHLLWSSDRLEIARDIDSRLTKIYADLVSLEKMMHYKHSIVDLLMSALPYINDEQGRRHTLVEECRRRWLRNAANQMHSDGYNGKYDDDYED